MSLLVCDCVFGGLVGSLRVGTGRRERLIFNQECRVSNGNVCMVTRS